MQAAKKYQAIFCDLNFIFILSLLQGEQEVDKLFHLRVTQAKRRHGGFWVNRNRVFNPLREVLGVVTIRYASKVWANELTTADCVTTGANCV